jgi:hypothetical protein
VGGADRAFRAGNNQFAETVSGNTRVRRELFDRAVDFFHV